MSLSKDRLTYDPASPSNSDTIGSYLLDSAGDEITSTLIGADQALDVNIAGGTGLAIVAEDSASVSGEDGQAIVQVREDALAISTSADGDYGFFKGTSKGEIYVKASDSDALLTTIDADTGSILADTNAMVIDLAAMEALLITIDADTGVIAGDTTSMDATLTALSKAEDAAHVSGDQGIMGLAVANHVEGAIHSTDGDYAPLQVDSSGRLRVIGDLDVVGNVADDAADSGNPLKIGSRSFDGALGAISASNDRADLLSDMYRRVYVNNAPNVGVTLSKPTVSAAQAEIAGTPQGGRTRMLVQNLSNQDIFVGPTGVLSTTGIRIAKNGYLELPWGEDIDLFAISAGAITSDVRVLEVA